MGFLWYIHGWLPVNVGAVRGLAGDDRLKVDPHPKPPLLNPRPPGTQSLCVKEALDFFYFFKIYFIYKSTL